MLNLIIWNRTVWSFNCAYLKNVYKLHILYLCRKGIWHWIVNNVEYTRKPNETIKLSLIWDTKGSPNLGQKTGLSTNEQNNKKNEKKKNEISKSNRKKPQIAVSWISQFQ